MVHVLKEVLRKIHGSLKASGFLLIVQPAPVKTIIQLEIDGKIEFNEEFEEPNFCQYLKATSVAVINVVEEKLFTKENEAIIPACNEYDSIDEWVEDHKPFCEDLDAFVAMSAKIRDMANGRAHRVLEYWREYQVLLSKFSP